MQNDLLNDSNLKSFEFNDNALCLASAGSVCQERQVKKTREWSSTFYTFPALPRLLALVMLSQLPPSSSE